jgi:hypothetical protein
MWTFLIDILFYYFLTNPKGKTPAVVVIALTVIVLGYAILTVINKTVVVN